MDAHLLDMSALRTWSRTFPVRSLTNGAAIAGTDLRSPEWAIQVQTKRSRPPAQA
jgi:hypothetical protein